ncbi:lactonase family protein [Reichenbachiella ulvae]|uniref:Lactonase family protein n=1 Tax=Reichenbachiella ulvae TaxID=2980104 RepID=A0ABT3CY63_9BACT|nr:lactonase family protein [Reichenbachiella ulvae]MCV9388641.1 lactonase family protein [Reichenbachiella ulvae]
MKTQIIPVLLLVVAIACSSPKKDMSNTQPVETTELVNIIVGTYTSKDSKGIYRVKFNPETGALSDTSLLVETTDPSYLAQSSDGEQVYAINAVGDGDVYAFEWNEDRSKLIELSHRKSMGDNPCYVALSPEDQSLALANYGSGNVVTYPVNSDGTIGEAGTARQHEGQGGDMDRQAGPHAHFSQFSSDGKYLYAVDLGTDQVIYYPMDSGRMGEGKVALQLDPADGPRHLDFHPSKAFVYVINELNSTIVAAKVLEDGSFERIEKVSTLPEGYEGESYCADIHVSKDGRFLYGSNRGHNSIAIFSIEEDGKLKMVATESVFGNWPRNFTLSPDNKFLLVANKKSDNITVFKRDDKTGMLHFTDQQIQLSQPVCLVFEK